MVWIGLDDTDSPRGGCTTWVLSELLRRVRDLPGSVDLIGYPRLVRLNPGVPWKTRGNASLGARLGHGRGRARRVGEIGGRPLWSYPREGALPHEVKDRVWETAISVLHAGSRWGEEGTDPTVVMTDLPLPEEIYHRAVHEVVPPGWVLDQLVARPDVRLAAFGSGRGVVGAAAALAWRGRRRTWEAIAYRPRARWGAPRRIRVEAARTLQERFPETFLSFDPETRRVLIAPHTPCPILAGVRGRRPQRLARALATCLAEPMERWVLYESNQATGDHLRPAWVREARAGTAGTFNGTVVADPEVLQGGHVRFEIEDVTGTLACMAFEPSRTLPALARALRPGDSLRVWGSIPWTPGPAPTSPALHLEGVRVLRAEGERSILARPRCRRCHLPMRSIGRGKGYRCRACGLKVPPEVAPSRWRSRRTLEGSYLPTPSARRHLSPLRAPTPALSAHPIYTGNLLRTERSGRPAR